MTTIVLGSGIAGISAGYHLKNTGDIPVIFEKNDDWGGLCENFEINGFRFDKFVHFSFAQDEYIVNIFNNSCKFLEHIPFPSNYYNGIWLRHPAQNNLAPLSTEEKVKIICDFVNKKNRSVDELNNYEEWLRTQYGDYFAETFPFKYTRKYWGVEPKELETKWVGKRMYIPELAQVLRGAFETQEECFYYAKVMKYPEKGGFRAILNTSRAGLDIRFNKEVIKIDTKNRQIIFQDGGNCTYTRLISTLPLPEMVNMLVDVPAKVKQAGENLMFTSGYMVSLGFNKPDITKHLWFYIYDEDILASRVYSPSLKSPDNVPDGCSSLQAEIFFANSLAQREERKTSLSQDEILENTISSLISMGLFKKEDILIKDIRFEKYANIIFDHDIYKNRKIVLDYLASIGIESIGRFGKWEYQWTHQAYADGMSVIRKEHTNA